MGSTRMKLNPYKNFPLRLLWNAKYVAGFSNANLDSDRLPLTLNRGLTCDPDFHQWCRSGSAQTKQDLALHLFNDEDQLVMSYQILRSWPAQYESLDGLPSEIPIERLMLHHEGVTLPRAGGDASTPPR